MANQPSDRGATREPTGRRISLLMVVSAAVMALLIGGLTAWALANVGGSVAGFVVAAIASGYYLYRKPVPSAAVGTGLYISAGLLVLTPIVFYVPLILEADGGGAEAAGTFLGGIVGLALWGFVFFLLALVVFTLGYFLNRRARRKLEERTDPEPATGD